MVLQMTIPQNSAKRLGAPRVNVVGAKTQAIGERGIITLPNMQPGENRWLYPEFAAPEGRPGEVLTLNFGEVAGGTVVNGFAVGVRLATDEEFLRQVVSVHRSILSRIAALQKADWAGESAAIAEKLLIEKAVSPSAYTKLVLQALPQLRRLVDTPASGDDFEIRPLLEAIQTQIQKQDVNGAALSHQSLLNKLDSWLTRNRIAAEGDVADILFNVRWQRQLFSSVPELQRLKCSSGLYAMYSEFVEGYGIRKITNRQFPELIKRSLQCFAEASQVMQARNLELEQDIKQMEENLGNLGLLQKAHRGFLSKLERLVK